MERRRGAKSPAAGKLSMKQNMPFGSAEESYQGIMLTVSTIHFGSATSARSALLLVMRFRLVYAAAALRAGGAMNSGPTGSLIVASRMRSISALAEASSR